MTVLVRKPPKPPVNKDNNPGGAKWCEDHQRMECTKNRRAGRGPCHMWAIRGTDTCRLHGGKKAVQLHAEGEARITAWNASGQRINLDASTAVMGVLQMSWLRLNTLSELLRQQVAKEGGVMTDLSDGQQNTGLIGFRYGMGGKDGKLYKQSEEVRALVALEAAERDRVVKYAKTAHDMGIAEQLTGLAERWGEMVAGRMASVLEALRLTPEQQSLVPHLLNFHLGSVDLEEIGGSVKERHVP